MKKPIEVTVKIIQEMAEDVGGTPERYPFSVKFPFTAGRPETIVKDLHCRVVFTPHPPTRFSTSFDTKGACHGTSRKAIRSWWS